ncbi:MAG: hypothetical protein ACRDC4_06395 [Plesiomonas sp.]
MSYIKAALAAKAALKLAEKELKESDQRSRQLKKMIVHLKAVSKMEDHGLFTITLHSYDAHNGNSNPVELVRYLRTLYNWGLKETVDKLKASNQKAMVLVENSDIEEITEKFNQIVGWGFNVTLEKKG